MRIHKFNRVSLSPEDPFFHKGGELWINVDQIIYFEGYELPDGAIVTKVSFQFPQTEVLLLDITPTGFERRIKS